MTFPLTGFSRSLLEALVALEAHFRERKIISHIQTPRMRNISTTFFVGVDNIVPRRDSSTDMVMAR